MIQTRNAAGESSCLRAEVGSHVGPPQTDVKTIQSKSTTTAPRYRLMVNDGINSNSMMLSTQMAETTQNGGVVEGTIIRVGEIISNDTTGKKWVWLLRGGEPRLACACMLMRLHGHVRRMVMHACRMHGLAGGVCSCACIMP